MKEEGAWGSEGAGTTKASEKPCGSAVASRWVGGARPEMDGC